MQIRKELFILHEHYMQYNSISYRIIRFTLRYLINIINMIICFFRFYFIKKKLIYNEAKCKYIISFTSFPSRMNKLWLVIESMINQKNVAEDYMIILYLSEEQFPHKKNDLPTKIKKQIERGLIVKFMPDDLKSHKKYIYSFHDYSDRCIITIDDDLLYLDDFLSELIKAHTKYPETVIANRAREIKQGETYLKWPLIYKKQILLKNVLTTNGAGTLFPPNSYDIQLVDENIVKKICFTADDLWLSFICRIKSPYVFYIGGNIECIDLELHQKESLKNINNDTQINANDNQITSITKWALKVIKTDFYLNKYDQSTHFSEKEKDIHI